MNPCMDCHALMFRLAGEIMRAQGFDFSSAGKCWGSGPCPDQALPALRGKALRPEGLHLEAPGAPAAPETIPEQNGQVDREKLLGISGRGRKDQIRLAAKFGLTDYPAPAGGCLLTEKGFSLRLKDLFEHHGDCTEEEVHLLKFGRHFRLTPRAKLIVGRTEQDNASILAYHNRERDVVIDIKDHPGPIGLLPGGGNESDLLLAASICVGYSKAPKLSPVDVVVKRPEGETTLQVIAIPPDDVRELML